MLLLFSLFKMKKPFLKSPPSALAATKPISKQEDGNTINVLDQYTELWLDRWIPSQNWGSD